MCNVPTRRVKATLRKFVTDSQVKRVKDRIMIIFIIHRHYSLDKNIGATFKVDGQMTEDRRCHNEVQIGKWKPYKDTTS